MVLRNVAGGWRLFTHPDTAPEVERFVLSSRQARLTKARWRRRHRRVQAAGDPPPDHVDPGVNSDGVLRALQDKGLVEEAGREETPGRPILFATTPSFLERSGCLPSRAAVPRPPPRRRRRRGARRAARRRARRAGRRAPASELTGPGDSVAGRAPAASARARGYGSRRACEQLVVEGRVTLNGTVAMLGDRGDPVEDEVRVDGLEVNLDPNVKYYALHKPPGVVTTMQDPRGAPTSAPTCLPTGRACSPWDGSIGTAKGCSC